MDPEAAQQSQPIIDDEADPRLDAQESPLRKHLGKWWLVYVLVVGALAMFLYRDLGRAADINGPLGTPLLVRSAPPGRNLWVMPDADVAAGGSIRGLFIHFGNGYNQQVSFRRGEGEGMLFRLESRSTRDALTLTSHEFKTVPGETFRVSGTLTPEGNTSGKVVLRVLARSEGEPTVLATATPTLTESFSQTFTVPAGSELFRVELVCRFKGTLLLTDVRLERTEPASTPAPGE